MKNYIKICTPVFVYKTILELIQNNGRYSCHMATQLTLSYKLSCITVKKLFVALVFCFCFLQTSDNEIFAIKSTYASVKLSVSNQAYRFLLQYCIFPNLVNCCNMIITCWVYFFIVNDDLLQMQTKNNISITTKVCKLFQLIADLLKSLKLVVRERKRKRPQLGILKVKSLKKLIKKRFSFTTTW